MKTILEQTEFTKAFRKIPMCMVGGLMGDERTVADLAFAVETEVYLTEEGQDGTSRRNLKPLRNWLRKFAPASECLRD